MIRVEMNSPETGHEPIKDYPCLGKSVHDDLVVLFFREGDGVVVAPTARYPAWLRLSEWTMSRFTPFKGKLTISNA